MILFEQKAYNNGAFSTIDYQEIRQNISSALNKVKINTLFAKAVIEQKTSGTIYIDDYANPQTYYINTPMVCRCYLAIQITTHSIER